MLLRGVAGAGARVGVLRTRFPTGAPSMTPALQQFHAGTPRKEEAKATPALSGAELKASYAAQPLFMALPEKVQNVVDTFQLTGVKRVVPFAIFLAVPTLAREWYMITEETMLLGCFGIFVGAVVDFGGASIAKYFDDQTAAIKVTHNDLEASQMKVVQLELEAHKSRLSNVDDVNEILDIQVEVSKRLAEAQNLMEKHKHREQYIRILETLKATRMKHIADLRSSEVAKALDTVQAQVVADKKLKKAALDNALIALADPAAAAKSDPVSKVFADYWKTKGVEMEKNKDQVVELTPEQVEAVMAETKATYAKWGGSPPTKAPTSYKLSDASLFY